MKEFSYLKREKGSGESRKMETNWARLDRKEERGEKREARGIHSLNKSVVRLATMNPTGNICN